MDFPFPQQPADYYQYQPTLNSVLEVISNDFNGAPISNNPYGMGDHLRPILDYLRQGNNEMNPTQMPRFFVPPPPHRPSVIQLPTSSSNANDGVIDLTSDDDEPRTTSSNRANQHDLIDLTITPPLSAEFDNENGNAGLIPKFAMANQNSGAKTLSSKDIGNISTKTASFNDSGASNLSLLCPVCLDGFDMIKAEGQRQLLSTKCGHVFCSSCINDIMHKQKCCPTCRMGIRKSSLRAIYL